MTKTKLIFLNLLPFSPLKIKKIISPPSNIEIIFRARSQDLQKISCLNEKDIEKIIQLKKSPELDTELKLIKKENIKILSIFDDEYPERLKETSTPPIILYIKGNPAIFKKNLFAIVGTRSPSFYGIETAKKFSRQLASLGLVIVSGLARGIDTYAHKEAIKEGLTIGVLGSGLLNIYPQENKKLSEEISMRGAVISEFPLNTPPSRENFPRRNRIISGLSLGVLVVQAAKRSGAIITAHLACEQNREVFAVPGRADLSISEGTNMLIKEGARLTEKVEDILEEIEILLNFKQNPVCV